MFYIIEKLRGSPDFIKGGLKFAQDDIYDYIILGFKTPEVKPDYYSAQPIRDWDNSKQKYSVDDFLKQVKAISKRENIKFLSRISIGKEAI